VNRIPQPGETWIMKLLPHVVDRMTVEVAGVSEQADMITFRVLEVVNLRGRRPKPKVLDRDYYLCGALEGFLRNMQRMDEVHA